MEKKTVKKHDLRLLFLREITKQLIINSTPKNFKVEPKQFQEEIKIQKPQMQTQMMASPRTKFETTIFPPSKKIIKYPQAKPKIGYPDLGKLNIFISDPRIQQIECYGPNKEITVKVSGMAQKTRIKLTKEEIDGILKKFSEQTRIPLLKGIFKAALGNLTITAVTSDFVDTKFTIQKGSQLNTYFNNFQPRTLRI